MKLAVQWPRFGPYHQARLQALHRFLEAQGLAMVGLETASREDLYGWMPEAQESAFPRVTVFPGYTYESLTPRAIHAGVTAALDRLQPDAVAINSYSLPDARACLTWCRRHRRTAVLMTDTKADDAARVGWREHIKRRILNLYDAALVAGTPHRAYLEQLGFPSPCIFTGYDVVDNAFFTAGADAARTDPDGIRARLNLPRSPFFLASNRFIVRKNLDGLLRAYQRYRLQSTAAWPLVLLGDGPGRPALETLVRQENIDGVTFSGFIAPSDVPACYGLAGAFVHPALADQWGLVVNEAMAAGLPVLVSERAGCALDLVRDGETGYRFDPNDPDALALLMTRIAAPETDRRLMGRHARARIAHWSPDTFAENLWAAVEAGTNRADRAFPLDARALLRLLRFLTRSATSFHSVEV